MSAPDASLLRRASPAYVRAVTGNPAPLGSGVGVAGYTVREVRAHAGCATLPLRLLLVTGDSVEVRLPLATARALASDMVAALPESNLKRRGRPRKSMLSVDEAAHSDRCEPASQQVRLTAGNGP